MDSIVLPQVDEMELIPKKSNDEFRYPKSFCTQKREKRENDAYNKLNQKFGSKPIVSVIRPPDPKIIPSLINKSDEVVTEPKGKLCNICGNTNAENFESGRNSKCKKCRSKTGYVKRLENEQVNKEKEMDGSSLSKVERDKFITFMKHDVSLYHRLTPFEHSNYLIECIERLTEQNEEKDILLKDLQANNLYIRKEFGKVVNHIMKLETRHEKLESSIQDLTAERNQMRSELDNIKSILSKSKLI